MSTLKEKYINTVAPALREEFQLSSVMQIPKIEKVVINKCVGEASHDAKLLETAVAELEAITGQKPVLTRARKSIASYKVREGQPIGCKVTLRGTKMWAFIETLFNVALPRVRDFKGISPRGFDQHGNYTLGIKEQIIFPQIVYDNVKKVNGFDVTFVISSESSEQSYKLLKMLGAPFTKTKGEK